MNRNFLKFKGLSGFKANSETQTRWICGKPLDLVMAFSWAPFSLIALAMIDNPAFLKTLMFSVFLFSFTHQPLSLFLVYGDQERFLMRRHLFTWSPILFGLVLYAAVLYSPTLLAILAGAWNAEHTLMQRYGINRIYGRMVGQNHGGSELVMFFSWLIFAVIWAAADPNTMSYVETLGIRGANRSVFELATQWQPIAESLVLPMMLWVGFYAIKWLLEEFQRPTNRAKQIYMASTVLLFIVILINPIIGFIGYVGAHSFEYFVIVNRSLEKSYIEPQRTDCSLGWVVNSGLGRPGILMLYLSAIAATVFILENYASFIVYSMVFFTLGALHFFYDGFIWKLRQPRVAESVGASA